MAITMTAAGTRITANAAAIAGNMAGGTSTADVQAIGALCTVLGLRPDLANPTQMLVSDALKVQFTTPG
jgi:hypothetical protein